VEWALLLLLLHTKIFVSRAKLLSKKLAGFSERLGKLVEFTIEKKTPKFSHFLGQK
jgi:hypothetical protein